MEFSIEINDKLALKSISQNDIPSLSEIYCDESTMSSFGTAKILISDLQNLVFEKQNRQKKLEELYFVLHHQKVNKSIGFFSLIYKNFNWYLEFCINKDYRQNGYCQIALKKLIEIVSENNITKLLAEAKVTNDASLHILKKFGFSFFGYSLIKDAKGIVFILETNPYP